MQPTLDFRSVAGHDDLAEVADRADTPACPRDGELHDKNRVTLAATDGSPEHPDRRHPGDGGRGLALVDALSERWGLDEHHDGKRVWIVLIPHPATTQAH